ncbi:MAG: glycosyltransferase family 2 protein [Spirochaetaceae bacterium]
MVDLTIIIPVYNGLQNIEPLLKELVPKLETLNKNWNILFIDDHSTDNAFDFLIEQNFLDSRISCIRLKDNRGQQNAVFCGLVQSKGRHVITMDDDLQHPIKTVDNLLEKIEEGYDLVYAVNRSSDRRLSLRFGSWINGLFFTFFLKKPYKIEIGSYRIFTRELIDEIKVCDNRFIYVSALIFSKVKDPKIFSLTYTPTITGSKISRINFKSRLKLFIMLFKNYGPLKRFLKVIGEPFEIEKVI